MTEKPKKPLDATSVNPRYEGLTRGGMAQLLTPAKNQAARAALECGKGTTRTPKESR